MQNMEFGPISGNVAVKALVVGVSMLYPLNLAAQQVGVALPSSAAPGSAVTSAPGSVEASLCPRPAPGGRPQIGGHPREVPPLRPPPGLPQSMRDRTPVPRVSRNVVINARKRTENLQEIPAPITYVGGSNFGRTTSRTSASSNKFCRHSVGRPQTRSKLT